MEKKVITKRQTEVLEKILEGESYKTTGRKLKIKYGTIKAHLRDIKERIGSNDTFHAITFAARAGVLDLRKRFNDQDFELLDKLSPREFEVLQKSICEDGSLRSYTEVAERLERSPKTIKKLRENIRGKVGMTIATSCLLLLAATAAGYEYKRRSNSPDKL